MTQPAPSAQHNGPEKGALTGPSDPPPAKTGGARPGLGLRLDVRILSLLGVLAALVLVGGITEPGAFLDTGNLQLILTQASVIGVVTVGMTFVIITGGTSGTGKEAAAESGRAPARAAKAGRGLGRPPMPCWVGWKSKSGASKGAIPYWTASSRPRSRGILGRAC